MAIEQKGESWEVTQAVAARRLGITQSRLNDLLRGKITTFNLDMLIGIATKADLTVRMQITKVAKAA
jgi:predicted XRE-type DNA-binding protein